jgi:hypothetical protein
VVAAGVTAALIAGGAIFLVNRGGDDTATPQTFPPRRTVAVPADTADGGPGRGTFRTNGTAGTIAASTARRSPSPSALHRVRSGAEAPDPSTSGQTSTVKVTTSDDTVVTETTQGAVSDVKAGDHVAVVGDTTNGTVTARRIMDTGDLADAGFGPRSSTRGGRCRPVRRRPRVSRRRSTATGPVRVADSAVRSRPGRSIRSTGRPST